MPMKASRGFTLVELVMVIALSSIVLLMITSVMRRPLEAYVDQTRRGGLVEQASVALNRMARDIRLSVPNSVRLSTDTRTLEMLNIVGAGRYVSNRSGGEALRFTSEVSGCATANGRCDGFQVLDPAFSSAGARWLVVYNVGAETGGAPTPGASVWAYADPGVITPTGTMFSTTTNVTTKETQVSLGGLPASGFTFAYPSPQRRFYLADHVVGYRCEPAATGGRLLRYTATQLNASAATAAPLNAAIVVPDVTACQFVYQPGNPQRPGMVTLGLTLTREGESVTLQQQVQVDNAP